MLVPPHTADGTSGNDNVRISKAGGIAGLLGLYEVNFNGSVRFMTKQQLENTDFRLGAGNYTLVVDSNVNASITVHGAPAAIATTVSTADPASIG